MTACLGFRFSEEKSVVQVTLTTLSPCLSVAGLELGRAVLLQMVCWITE